MVDMPPRGGRSGVDETRMPDAEGVFRVLKNRWGVLAPRFGTERIAAGQFEQSQLVGGQPGRPAGIEQKSPTGVLKHLRALIQSAVCGPFSGAFPFVIIVAAKPDTRPRKFDGRGHPGDVEKLPVAVRSVPSRPCRITDSSVVDYRHIDGPDRVAVPVHASAGCEGPYSVHDPSGSEESVRSTKARWVSFRPSEAAK